MWKGYGFPCLSQMHMKYSTGKAWVKAGEKRKRRWRVEQFCSLRSIKMPSRERQSPLEADVMPHGTLGSVVHPSPRQGTLGVVVRKPLASSYGWLRVPTSSSDVT